jgi:hypothetical protein
VSMVRRCAAGATIHDHPVSIAMAATPRIVEGGGKWGTMPRRFDLAKPVLWEQSSTSPAIGW